MIDLKNSDDWNVPLFPVSTVAKAAQLDVGTLRQWFVRNNISLWEGDRPAEKAGLPRLLTFRSLLNIATTARLVSGSGVKVSEAYIAAAEWTHTYSDDDLREAGGLYPGDKWTFLIFFKGGESKVVATDRNGRELGFRYEDLFFSREIENPSPIIVFLDPVFKNALAVCEHYLRGE